MSSIDTVVPTLAVLSVTIAGVAALPWNTREIADSAKAFAALGRLSIVLLGRLLGGGAPQRTLAASSSVSR